MPYLAATVFFVAYTAYAVRKHELIRSTGYDLGIFEQAVRAYAHGRAPIVELKGPGFNLLGDHFHPILMLLAPFYRVFPSPVTLLVAQAALMAASVIPIGRAASRSLGTANGLGVAVAYGMSWGLQEAVAFDFHEVCFAVPLLAFSLERLLRRDWRAAVAWAAPLILVKEDLPLTVAAIGGYLILRRQWRLGAITVLGGVAATVVIMAVLLPTINHEHNYVYWHQLGSGPGTPGGWPAKLATVVALLALTGFVAIRSPLLIVAAPTLAWRFASDNSAYWGTGYHYSAVLMPIMFAAMIEVMGGMVGGRPGVRRPGRIGALRTVIVVGCLVNAVLTAAGRPGGELLDPTFWRPDPRVAAARSVLDRIPNGATVAATNRLVPQLTARCGIRMFPAPGSPTSAEWVVADAVVGDWPYPVTDVLGELAVLRAAGYHTVTETGGFVLLHRGP